MSYGDVIQPSREKHFRTLPKPPATIVEPSLAIRLLDLHTAISLHDLWRILRELAGALISTNTIVLEVESGVRGQGTWHRSCPIAPNGPRYDHSDPIWQAQHTGAPTHRISANESNTVHALCLFSWRGRKLQGALTFHRRPDEPDFTSRDVRIITAIQPHFHIALSRVLSCEQQVFRAEQIASMLRDFPIGLLVLDWDLAPVWFNEEAGFACAVWNHGERRAAALNPKSDFKLPAALAGACAQLREQWSGPEKIRTKGHAEPAMVSHPTLGLHAQITVRRGASDVQRRAFQIRIDYRRPRGDRHCAVSPGALALLARLTTREWEVAMKIREGQRTAEIAQAFHRSPMTIKTQLGSIFTKLGVRNRAHVAALLNR